MRLPFYGKMKISAFNDSFLARILHLYNIYWLVSIPIINETNLNMFKKHSFTIVSDGIKTFLIKLP